MASITPLQIFRQIWTTIFILEVFITMGTIEFILEYLNILTVKLLDFDFNSLPTTMKYR